MLKELLEEISHRYLAIDDVLRDVSKAIVFGAGGSGKHAYVYCNHLVSPLSVSVTMTGKGRVVLCVASPS